MISTHVLDQTEGMPAKGITVLLEKQEDGKWQNLETANTNDDGRIAFNCPAEAGNYRLTFDLEAYFNQKQTEAFFINAPLAFKIKDTNRKYHVPLLLNPYGYATYRGS